jgi:Ricin-type beta-trefoil lectin domain-like
VGNSYVTAVNAGSTQCLDVTAGSMSPGANVEQWTCNGQSPQIWNLQQR